MNELKTEIVLSEKKKIQIIENAHQIAKQRKKALKLRYCSTAFLLLIIGITGFLVNRHYGIINEMLSQQLHDLGDCGMIHREVIPEKPPKTIYSLTAFGQSIIPLLDAMCQWGTNYLDGLDMQPPCCKK